MIEISKQYSFEDFTFKNYHILMEIAKSKYQFSFFQPEYEKKSDHFILLRHDVEFSVPIALELAKIENKLGINSTFFIQLHSEFYNALEEKTFNLIKEIEKLGHQLGLHFDSHFWKINDENQLVKYLEIDKETFSKYFDSSPLVFSFHNNDSFTLSCNKDKYAGMINVYSNKYKHEFGYCSDSTGYWRYERLEDRLREAKDNILQILIHDGMWQEKILPPRRRVYKVIDDNAEFMKKNYDMKIKQFGAKNIDWYGEI
jgi:peptidoglycan/xylan/chitin deacetylase (PgdA/CDA1 family)